MRIAYWKTQMTQQQGRLCRRLARFRADDEGSLVVFSLFLIIAMLIIGGLGVDLMLYETQRTRLQATLDRAILAAAHPSQTPGELDDRKEVVLSYFKSAGLEDFIDPEDVKVVASGTASEVTAEARMHVDPLLLQFVGIEGFEAVAAGAAAQSAGLSEVSLVVDVSGSMNSTSTTGSSKIEELKTAATQFVNILLCDPNNPTSVTNCTMPANTTSVSLIPYNAQVTAGADILTKFNRRDQHSASYCATFYPDEFTTTAFSETLDIRQTGLFDSSTYGTGSAYAGRFPCPTDSWRNILPLSSSHTDLGTRIGQLRGGGYTSIDIGLKWGVTMLDPSIATVVDGLVDDLIVDTAFVDRPRAYGAANSQKVVVLMTDGQNTEQSYLFDEYRSGPSRVWKNTSDPSKFSIHYENDPNTDLDDQWLWPWVYDSTTAPSGSGKYMDHPYGENDGAPYCNYRTYGGCQRYRTESGSAEQMTWQEVWLKKRWGWWLSLPNVSWPGATMYRSYRKQGARIYTDGKDKRLLDLCTAAKNEGIKIYTIELETDGGGSGGNVLESCSSGDGYYFKVDGVDLVETFSTIGQDIAKLRLTK